MKKTLKIFSILLMVVLVITFSTSVLAAPSGTPINPSDLEDNINYGDSADTSDLMTKAGKIMGMIRNVAVIAAVIIIMILGVKYMLGSIEEKAEYKKSFMPLIIGIILVVAATSIATFIFGLVD